METCRRSLYRVLASLLMLLAFSLSLCAKDFVVMLDPGHGGHDPGAEGVITSEKVVNLAVAKKVAAILQKELPGVKISYTRSKDRYISLVDRARLANNRNADIFVSIHCDASEANPEHYGSTMYTPLEKLVSGSKTAGGKRTQTNADNLIAESNRLGRLLSSEMAKTAGRVNRGVRQRDLLVLQYTRMPSVLVELDYICNPTQEKYLASADGQDQMARAIANAIKQYAQGKSVAAAASTPAKASTPARQQPDSSRNAKSRQEQAAPSQAPAASSDAQGDIVYKVQFMTSGRKLAPNAPEFKGLSPVDYYMDGKTYKYTFGSTTSMVEARNFMARVRSVFPDAFIVKFKDGKRIK